ncbi:albusnodin family lasso peptide [Streptomyces sp. NPDC016469]|uniref:albusnodin family lasso peptide n=1 Tax=Streptomyces sp. NPDC016469 TaxID=3157191 RepID=UPI0034094B65
MRQRPAILAHAVAAALLPATAGTPDGWPTDFRPAGSPAWGGSTTGHHSHIDVRSTTMVDAHNENSDTSAEKKSVAVDLGDVAELTEGQGGGQSEDKRRAYNC